MSPQIVNTLNDIAPNGWEKMQLHELTQSMRQKDMKFVNCLNKIHKTVPLEGSEEDRMLQSHELKLNPNHENYPHDAMHVYAQNVHCDAWNEHTQIASWKRIHKCSKTVKMMTALNLQMLQCLPIHMKQVICKKFKL